MMRVSIFLLFVITGWLLFGCGGPLPARDYCDRVTVSREPGTARATECEVRP